MRKPKIRGHKRIWKAIEEWKIKSMQMDVGKVQQKYVKIRINPYMTYAFLDTPYTEPNGETRRRMLVALLDIYHAWKIKLDSVGEPYYLKLWLFEPQFTKSQVVCAASDAIDFYENTFFRPEGKKEFPIQNYGKLEDRLKNLTWEHGHYENYIDSNSIGEPEEFNSLQEYYANRRWVKRKLIRPHRQEISALGEELNLYKIGDVWLGSI